MKLATLLIVLSTGLYAGIFELGKGTVIKGTTIGDKWPIMRLDAEVVDEDQDTVIAGGLTLTGLELFWYYKGEDFTDKPDTCRIARDCKATPQRFGLVQSRPCEGGLCIHARIEYLINNALTQKDWFIEPVPEPAYTWTLALLLILGILKCKR